MANKNLLFEFLDFSFAKIISPHCRSRFLTTSPFPLSNSVTLTFQSMELHVCYYSKLTRTTNASTRAIDFECREQCGVLVIKWSLFSYFSRQYSILLKCKNFQALQRAYFNCWTDYIDAPKLMQHYLFIQNHPDRAMCHSGIIKTIIHLPTARVVTSSWLSSTDTQPTKTLTNRMRSIWRSLSLSSSLAISVGANCAAVRSISRRE